MVNPSADVIVLPSFSCVGNLVPVSAVSVALAEPVLPGEECGTLPDHLEDIVMGSHPFLGEAGQLLLRNLLHRSAHVWQSDDVIYMFGCCGWVCVLYLGATGPWLRSNLA